MRLIDAHTAWNNAGKISRSLSRIDAVRKYIYEQPTVDAAPVGHAHWENIGTINGNEDVIAATCSHCGKITAAFRDDGLMKRCSWCGYVMNQEETNETD